MRFNINLCLFLIIVSICRMPALAGDVFENLSSLDKDAYVHFSAGVIASHISYPLFKHYLHDKKRAMWYSLLFAAALSLGKEIYDINKTGFSGSDLTAGTLGGATILVVQFE